MSNPRRTTAAEDFRNRTRNGHEDQHGRRNGDGKRLSAPQGQGLGDKFTHQHMKVGDDGKAGRDRQNMGIERLMGKVEVQRLDPAQQHARGQRLADPAQREGAKRNPQLNSGKKVVQVALQPTHRARARYIRRDHLFDAGVADAHQRELRSHKKGVGQDQHGHGDKLQQGKLVHLVVRIALVWSG